MELIKLEAKESKEAWQIQMKKLQMKMKKERSGKDRELEWERTRRGLSLPKAGSEGGEKSVRVRSLQLIPEFGEQKVAGWFKRFEMMMEFGCSPGRWHDLWSTAFMG